MSNIGKKGFLLLLFVFSFFLAPPCWSQPSEINSLTNFLKYLNSLEKCVKERDLSECSTAVEGKLLEPERKLVKKIQEEIEEQCIDSIGGGVSGAFNCYLSWVSGAYDSVTKKIMSIAEVRTNAMGNALYVACSSNSIAQTPKSKVKKCLNGCDNNNFMSCKKAMEICLTTNHRGAMDVCVQKNIDISSNPNF